MDIEDDSIIEPIEPPDGELLLGRFARLPHCVLLDSAMPHPSLGRYSFLAADPFAFIEIGRVGPGFAPVADLAQPSTSPPPSNDPFGRLQSALSAHRAETIDGLPPFQGGAAGVFAYELGRAVESVPAPRWDEFQTPVLAVGLYDVVVAWDHIAGRAWLVSRGFPAADRTERRRRARQRRDQFRRWIDEAVADCRAARGRRAGAPVGRLPFERLCPQYPVDPPAGWPRAAGSLTSNFDRHGYLEAVGRVIDRILAGDVFQVNLAQRLLLPASDDSVALYRRLRRRNAAPFAGYFDAGGWQVLSASPERFLRVDRSRVETRPIKGTRRRTAQANQQREAADELARSEKDIAENVMIVDLLRNDLARVCRPESIRVSQLCGVEHYAKVLHLVSAVEGVLRDRLGPIDLLRAAFPGGSITGAPKIRAMEIIAELEPTARGPYCGAMGYVGFDGAMDLNVLIRTITAARGWWQIPVGGGVVAHSDPEAEYDETWQKAAGTLDAVAG